MTYQRNKIWKDGLSLWSDVILKSPHKVRAYINRGAIFCSKLQYDQALVDFDKAIEINTKLAEAYHDKGVVYAAKGTIIKHGNIYARQRH